MLAFITSILEIVGLFLKTLIKSCRSRRSETKEHEISTLQNTERSNIDERERGAMPKKPRRASITKKTIQTNETTTIYELSGFTPSPDPETTDNISRVVEL